MPADDELLIGPEMSQEFRNFEEFCSDNSSHELTYFALVSQNPLAMDSITLAFSMRRLVRLSKELLEMLLTSAVEERDPTIKDVLDLKGIQLDKSRAAELRNIIFAFRDTDDDEAAHVIVRAFQLIAMARERTRIGFNLAESYQPPQEGWTTEDFDGDDLAYETIRAVEDPHWNSTED